MNQVDNHVGFLRTIGGAAVATEGLTCAAGAVAIAGAELAGVIAADTDAAVIALLGTVDHGIATHEGHDAVGVATVAVHQVAVVAALRRRDNAVPASGAGMGAAVGRVGVTIVTLLGRRDDTVATGGAVIGVSVRAARKINSSARACKTW